MSKRYYYAEVKEDAFGNFVCCGLLDTFKERTDSRYIRLDVYDTELLGKKMWTGTRWTDNPNYVPPQEDDLIST